MAGWRSPDHLPGGLREEIADDVAVDVGEAAVNAAGSEG